MSLQQHLQALREAMGESQSYLEKVMDVAPSVTEMLHKGEWDQAFAHLKQVFHGLIYLNNFLESAIETLELDLDELHIDGKSARDILQQLNKEVKNMLGATETGDQIALGTMVAGSFRSSLYELKSIFAHLNSSYLTNTLN